VGATSGQHMSKALILISLICFIGLLYANTLTVNHDGSAQYTTIQSAINASANGDIVLVYPGTYYENVDYNGKEISLESLEATTNDTTYISTTIIDGNNTGCCVRFHNAEQNATLRGFTLTHGIGYPVFGDNQRRGGGVYIYIGCNVIIANCIITQNRSAEGAGIFMDKSSALFSDVKIHHNYSSDSAGGIYIISTSHYTSNIIFDPANRCSIYENYGMNPCDIVVVDVMQNIDFNLDMFSLANPDNFYIGRYNNFSQTIPYSDHLSYQRTYRTEIDHDLYVSPDGDDSNSGFSADQALKTITVAMHRVASDSLNRNTVYVLPGTYNETEGQQIFPIPLKSNVNLVGAGSDLVNLYADFILPNIIPVVIGTAQQRNMILSGLKITAANNGYRFPFAAGVITNGKFKDIVIDGVQVANSGALYLSVLINTEFDGLVVRNIITKESCFNVSGYWVSGSMRNCIFDNIHSTFNITAWDAVAMFNIWVTDSLTIENCKFSDFSVMTTQPTFHISDLNSDNTPLHINVNNCLFDKLRVSAYYPVGFNNRNGGYFKISNCTFVNNQGPLGAVELTGTLTLRNNIFNNPTSTKEIYMEQTAPIGYSTYLNFDYNNIRNGQAGISNPHTNNILAYGANNNTGDPLFESINPLDDNYLYLTADSPCRDTGTPDTLGLSLPIMDLEGNYRIWNNRIDMGCYEYGSEPVGNEDPVSPILSNQITLSTFPNPVVMSGSRGVYAFIEFTLTQRTKELLQVEIFNIKGQRVKSMKLNESYTSLVHKAGLSDQVKQNGEFFSTAWDCRNDQNQEIASGLYIVRVTSGSHQAVKKMMVVK
jgi:hypothetical protein